jgi:hypothetical protein
LFNRKFVIAIILLIGLIAVSAVAADEDVGEQALGQDADGEVIAEDLNDDSLEKSADENTEILSKSDETPALGMSEGQYVVDAKSNGGKKISAKLEPMKLSTTYGSGDHFKVAVVDSKTNKLVSNAKLVLKVYTGKKYKKVTLKTRYYGVAEYDASKLGIGKHKIVVSSASGKVAAKSKTSYVTVKKATLDISAPKTVNDYKKGSFKVTVKNKKTSNPVKGVKVKIKVYTGKKYKTYSVKTNAKGVASISTKSLSKATHKVAVNVKKTSKYKSASKKSSIKIVKKVVLKTHFRINAVQVTLRDGDLDCVDVDADLIDEKGNVINSKKVSAQVFAQWTRFTSAYNSNYIHDISDKYTQNLNSKIHISIRSTYGGTSIRTDTDEMAHLYVELKFAGDSGHKACSAQSQATSCRVYIGSGYYDASGTAFPFLC